MALSSDSKVAWVPPHLRNIGHLAAGDASATEKQCEASTSESGANQAGDNRQNAHGKKSLQVNGPESACHGSEANTISKSNTGRPTAESGTGYDLSQEKVSPSTETQTQKPWTSPHFIRYIANKSTVSPTKTDGQRSNAMIPTALLVEAERNLSLQPRGSKHDLDRDYEAILHRDQALRGNRTKSAIELVAPLLLLTHEAYDAEFIPSPSSSSADKSPISGKCSEQSPRAKPTALKCADAAPDKTKASFKKLTPTKPTYIPPHKRVGTLTVVLAAPALVSDISKSAFSSVENTQPTTSKNGTVKGDTNEEQDHLRPQDLEGKEASPRGVEYETSKTVTSQVRILKGYLESTILGARLSGDGEVTVHQAANNQSVNKPTFKTQLQSHECSPVANCQVAPSGRGGRVVSRAGFAPRLQCGGVPQQNSEQPLPQKNPNPAPLQTLPATKWKARRSRHGFVINEDSGSSHQSAGLDFNSGSQKTPSEINFDSFQEDLVPVKRAWFEWAQACPMEEVWDADEEFRQGNSILVSRNWLQYESLECPSLTEFWKIIEDSEPPVLHESDSIENPWWETLQIDQQGRVCLMPFIHIPANMDENDPSFQESNLVSINQRLRSSENRGNNLSHHQLQPPPPSGTKPVPKPGKIRYPWDLSKPDTIQDEPDTCAWGFGKHLPDPVKTKKDINLYIRDGLPSDIEDVRGVYNRLVKLSWWTLDSVRVSTDHLGARFNRVVDKNLPWLVAHKHARPSVLVGFALIDDLGDTQGFMNISASIEVYVDRAHQNQGVGKALLDQLLSYLDIQYKPQCKTTVFETRAQKAKRSRAIVRYKSITSVIAKVPYAPEDGEDLTRMKWMDKWLTRFRFKKCGDLPAAMCRKGRFINVALYSRKITANNLNMVSDDDD